VSSVETELTDCLYDNEITGYGDLVRNSSGKFVFKSSLADTRGSIRRNVLDPIRDGAAYVGLCNNSTWEAQYLQDEGHVEAIIQKKVPCTKQFHA